MHTTGEKDEEYVVYDQFHWNDPNHLEYVFKGRDYALKNYVFLVRAHPDKSLGFTLKKLYIEKFKHFKIKCYERRKETKDI